MSPDEQSAEDGFRKQIQNAVEDGLRVGRDDVAALTETPSDWVEEPEECGHSAADEEGAADVLSELVSTAARVDRKRVGDDEERNAAEDEVSEFVRGLDEGANKSRDDHDLVDEDDPENGQCGHAGCQEEISEQQRSGDEPG